MPANHDLVIRAGRVIDGSGSPGTLADVAINDGVITAVSARVPGTGAREIDASGLVVCPGWVDVHSHYDGQATWDPYLTPTSYHGVTTTVFGNCGVGFAPIRSGQEPWLINLMEGVEDIPGSVLAEGIDWGAWETFPEYMDVLESMPRIMDIGCQIPHGALRFFCMGDRGADHREIPTSSECQEMKALVTEGLRAGALGFTTARTIKHMAADGRVTPGYSAHDNELNAIAEGMREAGAGVIETNLTDPTALEDLVIMRRMAELAGRPLTVLLLQIGGAPELWQGLRQGVHDMNASGIECTGQVGCRPVGILLGWRLSVNPFIHHPTWKRLCSLPVAERIAKLQQSEELRAQLLSEHTWDPTAAWRPMGAPPSDGEDQATAFHGFMDFALSRISELVSPTTSLVEYEPDLSVESLVARATTAAADGVATTTVDPYAVALEILLQGEGESLLLYPHENYVGGDLEVVRELLMDEHTISGLGDAGAHVGTICDGSYPTFLLTHWARDRTRGEGLPLEFLIRKQTRRTAEAFGLLDRGLLQPGFKADINIIDFDNLRVLPPTVEYDLLKSVPTARRLMQKATGYVHTIVSGVVVSSGGAPTGELPGKLIRGAQPLPLVSAAIERVPVAATAQPTAGNHDAKL